MAEPIPLELSGDDWVFLKTMEGTTVYRYFGGDDRWVLSGSASEGSKPVSVETMSGVVPFGFEPDRQVSVSVMPGDAIVDQAGQVPDELILSQDVANACGRCLAPGLNPQHVLFPGDECGGVRFAHETTWEYIAGWRRVPADDHAVNPVLGLSGKCAAGRLKSSGSSRRSPRIPPGLIQADDLFVAAALSGSEGSERLRLYSASTRIKFDGGEVLLVAPTLCRTPGVITAVSAGSKDVELLFALHTLQEGPLVQLGGPEDPGFGACDGAVRLDFPDEISFAAGESIVSMKLISDSVEGVRTLMLLTSSGRLLRWRGQEIEEIEPQHRWSTLDAADGLAWAAGPGGKLVRVAVRSHEVFDHLEQRVAAELSGEVESTAIRVFAPDVLWVATSTPSGGGWPQVWEVHGPKAFGDPPEGCSEDELYCVRVAPEVLSVADLAAEAPVGDVAAIIGSRSMPSVVWRNGVVDRVGALQPDDLRNEVSVPFEVLSAVQSAERDVILIGGSNGVVVGLVAN
jgi:hypothetical protein